MLRLIQSKKREEQTAALVPMEFRRPGIGRAGQFPVKTRRLSKGLVSQRDEGAGKR